MGFFLFIRECQWFRISIYSIIDLLLLKSISNNDYLFSNKLMINISLKTVHALIGLLVWNGKIVRECNWFKISIYFIIDLLLLKSISNNDY